MVIKIHTLDGKGNISGDERGIAVLSVMIVLLLLTVLGGVAITATSLENRIAGFSSSAEAASAAAESCAGTAVNIISQALDLGEVPEAYVVGKPTATNPIVPANAENATSFPPSLTQEIYGLPNASNDPDTSETAPDISFAVGAFAVAGDIDRLYQQQKPGAPNGVIDAFYRITCTASNVATGVRSRVEAVYDCVPASGGDSCQRKI